MRGLRVNCGDKLNKKRWEIGSVLNRLTFQLNWENRLYSKIDPQNRLYSSQVDFENRLLKIIDFGDGIFDFYRIQRIR